MERTELSPVSVQETLAPMARTRRGEEGPGIPEAALEVTAFGAPKERTQASSVRAWPPGLLRRDGGERTHGRKRGGETGGERRVEPAKEKLGETVDGAPAWLRKETKKD